ncbi:MAG: DUF1553 domain-containing protein [Phycisphaerae bacterium]|nr:DUF1553 domain-containing protein [Phycisphaerae bacterium]
MRIGLSGAVVLLVVGNGLSAAEPRVVRPFEGAVGFKSANRIDTPVAAALRERDIAPANRCSDEVFVRRVYLDVIGTLPEPQAVQAFLQDDDRRKREKLIDELLVRDEFADYWAMKWCDLLRVKAEFPINLWPNAVQAYHRWIRDAVRDNMPYDQFARELLTSSGSNFRVPPVNFYRAVQGRAPATMAEAVALTFMGTRLQSWPEVDRNHMAVFFSRVAFKATTEWKEEIICLDPAPGEALDVTLPDGTAVRLLPEQDPRAAFADWLLTPENPWFTRNIANRVWSWFFGRGIVHEPDDIRPDNPPSNPELLERLEKELVRANYDPRRFFRLILNSATYQQSSIPQSDHREAEALFAYYPVRRLDAEVLIDALCWAFGGGESYTSVIPEPFTFIPESQRTIALADGSISSQFLEMFGRPARDTGLESERNNQPTDAQRLHMLNSSHVQKRIQQSARLRRVITTYRRNQPALISGIYLTILSRYPTDTELVAAQDYFGTGGLTLDQAVADLAWVLVNSKEFLYRH